MNEQNGGWIDIDMSNTGEAPVVSDNMIEGLLDAQEENSRAAEYQKQYGGTLRIKGKINKVEPVEGTDSITIHTDLNEVRILDRPTVLTRCMRLVEMLNNEYPSSDAHQVKRDINLCHMLLAAVLKSGYNQGDHLVADSPTAFLYTKHFQKTFSDRLKFISENWNKRKFRDPLRDSGL